MENTIISNLENFKKIKSKILKEGTKNLHIIADFDGTLTKLFVNGEKSPSIIAELRNGNYLDEDYAKKAHTLFDKYHPYEIDSNLPTKEKKEKMKEWWETHFKLLIEKGLSLEDITKISKSGRVELRKGIENLLNFTKENNIPFIIMSASGIGDIIPMYLKEKGLLYDNIKIISNLYKWNKNGIAIGVKKPIVHSGNKDETTLEKLPIYSELKKRKNVLLLGNGMNDLDMVKGFNYNNLLSIGFLEDDNTEKINSFKSGYDVVITNDNNLNFINNFLKEFNN
jgi:5'-nucleotidase